MAHTVLVTPKSDLFTDNHCHFKGMDDVGFSRFSAHAFMSLIGHLKGFPDQLFVFGRFAIGTILDQLLKQVD